VHSVGVRPSVSDPPRCLPAAKKVAWHPSGIQPPVFAMCAPRLSHQAAYGDEPPVGLGF
jgi:hypothetical protein